MIDSVETLEGKANTAVITINGVESLWFYGTLIGGKWDRDWETLQAYAG